MITDGRPAETWLASVRRGLLALGFNHQNALPCLAICRDEICADFRGRVESAWGQTFALGSLAGLPTLGTDGMIAALSHAPLIDGRQRLVVLGLPHIGVTRRGELGAVERPGLTEPVPTCGALVGVLPAVARVGDATQSPDEPAYRADPANQDVPANVESEWLRLRLMRHAAAMPASDDPMSIEALTTQALEVIEHDLRELLGATPGMDDVDYALATGILVHRHGKPDEVAPGRAIVSVRGDTTELALDTPLL